MDINIKFPELTRAAEILAKAMANLASAMTAAEKETAPADVNPAPATAPAAAVNVSAPAQSPLPAPTVAPAPTAPSPTAVPTSPAPQITGDMVAKAGADLLAQNPAVMQQLMGLLQKYGVGCAQELRPDQIGPFATEMRALGARI